MAVLWSRNRRLANGQRNLRASDAGGSADSAPPVADGRAGAASVEADPLGTHTIDPELDELARYYRGADGSIHLLW